MGMEVLNAWQVHELIGATIKYAPIEYIAQTKECNRMNTQMGELA